MTTTDAMPDIHDYYSPAQITRMAALQGAADVAWALSGTIGSGVLIDLAEYVIGDDEPFDPVAEAHKAMAAIRFERGEDYNGYDDHDEDGNGFNYEDEADYSGWLAPTPGAHEDGPLADWERELLALEEVVVGDITVSDLAGFETLPLTAVLLDVDGDTWRYEWSGWAYAGASPRNRYEIFADLGDENREFHFIVTNPEVLA